MRVLFYVEPLVERENPTWKSYWVSFFVKHFIDALMADGMRADELACIVPAALLKDAQSLFPDILVNTIDHSEFIPKFADTSLEIASGWYRNIFNKEQRNAMASLIINKLGDFQPDICISFSPASFIQDAYHDVKILHCELGFVSRPPFPKTIYFDPVGLYEYGVLGKFKAEIHSYKPNQKEMDLVEQFRLSFCSNRVGKENPLNEFIEPLLLNFENNILLSLQFSNFYAYDAHAKFKDQYDLLIYTLEATPENIGVIVCEHPEHVILSPETISFLKNKYKNFVWHSMFRVVYGASFFLMPYVKGVVTVSSSVGMQALLWKRKLAVIGHSHLDIACDTHSVQELCNMIVKDDWPHYKESLLAWLLTKFHLPFDLLVSAKNFKKFLNNHLLNVDSNPVTIGSLSNISTEKLINYYQDYAINHPFAALGNANFNDPDNFYASLYYADSYQEFNNSNCITNFISWSQSSIVTVEYRLETFKLSAIKLRLDPINQPGNLIIRELKYLDSQGNVVWEWDGSIASLGILYSIHVYELDVGSGLLLACETNDPKIELFIDQKINQSEINSLILVLTLEKADDELVFSVRSKLKEKNLTLNHHNNLKDTQIAELNQNLYEETQKSLTRNHEINLLNQNLAERNHEINLLNQNLAERNHEINLLNQNLYEETQKGLTRNHEINLLNQNLAERNYEVNLLNQIINDQKNQLNQIINDQKNQIESLRLTSSQQGIYISNLQNNVKVLEENIHLIKQSTSWRLTKPVRLISHITHRAIGMIKNKRLSFNKVENTILNEQVAITEKLVGLEEHPEFNQVIDDEPKDNAPEWLNDLVIEDPIKSTQLSNHNSQLPTDFNSSIYLLINPDVALSQITAEDHFIHHGIQEGRRYKISDIFINDNIAFNSSKPTILFVTHDAVDHYDDLAIFALSLIKDLSNNYNIVTLLLSEGVYAENFISSSYALRVEENLRSQPQLTGYIINDFCQNFQIQFCLVNGVESRDVLPSLSQHLVPSITLINDFASKVRPETAFSFVFDWSSEIVFSSQVVLNTAKREYYLKNRIVNVKPHGLSKLPSQIVYDREHIRKIIKPSNLSENTKIVVGVGNVDFNYGVDLFIDCATRIMQQQNGKDCRFVWIGRGYNPLNDSSYSVYIADQLKRSGLDGMVLFVGDILYLEYAYEVSDLFLLTSRLVGLTNSVIQAMHSGLPIISFQESVLNECFVDEDIQNACIVPYQDTIAMAQKGVELLNNTELATSISAKIKNIAQSFYNQQDYLSQITSLGDKAMIDCQCRIKQLEIDVETIAASNLLREDFYSPQCQQYEDSDLRKAELYILNWAVNRKPCPGFNPKIYEEVHGLAYKSVNPFADFIRSGKPSGPWLNKVIDNHTIISKGLPVHGTVALHIHAYYLDYLPKVAASLNCNQLKPDIFISVKNEALVHEAYKLMSSYLGEVVEVKVVPNIGRDIGPLITQFGLQILQKYQYFGHIHSKKTYQEHVSVGESWLHFLTENLIGGDSGPMMDRILGEMYTNPEIGMVFPDDPNICGWSVNYHIAKKLSLRLGIDKLPSSFNFPVGTMFWAHIDVLRPFVNMHLDWSDYPVEPIPNDGTILHAIERLLPLVLDEDKVIATTNIRNISR